MGQSQFLSFLPPIRLSILRVINFSCFLAFFRLLPSIPLLRFTIILCTLRLSVPTDSLEPHLARRVHAVFAALRDGPLL